MPEFNPWLVCLGFMVDAMELGQIFLKALVFLYQVSFFTSLHIHYFYCSSYAVKDCSALEH